MPEEQLELPHTTEYVAHRKKVISTLFGSMRRRPFIRWDGENQSCRKVLIHVCRDDSIGRRFIRETKPEVGF